MKGIPQIIILALTLLGMGMDLERSGKPKTGNHSFVASAIAAGLMLALLWWGGFWDVFLK